MKSNHTRMVIAVLVALAFGASLGCSPSKGPQGKPAIAGTGGTAEAKPVRVAMAGLRTLRPYIDESGDVEASVNVAVYPDIGGRIISYKVAIGDSVQKGQTLAVVDPSKPGSDYSMNPVVSPLTGTVTDILAQEGETVASGTSIAKVGIIDELKITVALAERDSAKARKGMAAIVEFAAMPGESFKATVTRVSPVLDSTSRTREITLGLSSRDVRISSGMYAKVRLYTDPVEGAVVIPASAVMIRNGENFVFTVSSGSGKSLTNRRVVKTGVTVDSDIAILDGLSPGEAVVYEGQDGLSGGVTVTIVGEAEK